MCLLIRSWPFESLVYYDATQEGGEGVHFGSKLRDVIYNCPPKVKLETFWKFRVYLPSLQFDITEVTFLHTHSLLQWEKNSSKKISSKREKFEKVKKRKKICFVRCLGNWNRKYQEWVVFTKRKKYHSLIQFLRNWRILAVLFRKHQNGIKFASFKMKNGLSTLGCYRIDVGYRHTKIHYVRGTYNVMWQKIWQLVFIYEVGMFIDWQKCNNFVCKFKLEIRQLFPKHLQVGTE